MRACLHRTEVGQFDDNRVDKIYAKAKELCTDYFNAFPDVDTCDLLVILLSEANYVKAFTMLDDAAKCNTDCRECPNKTFDSDSSQEFICDKYGHVVK